jgi:class 3 adenylate cyclase/DNA-binding CsgD family transcriptional regulator
VFGAEGEPVERASGLAREAGETGVLVEGEAAAVVSDRFRLEPTGDRAYRVLGRSEDDGTLDAARPPFERRIRTILTTDIVSSTRTVERLGDRAWGELVAAHERATRSELARFGGEEIDTTGDGFIVAFDSPARAIRFALALLHRMAALGLTTRAGIHTGEVEHVRGRARGIALHVATRVAARANPGEILVTATTRELAAGGGLMFTSRGEHTLKGVSESRRLYAVVEAPRAEARARELSQRPGESAGASETGSTEYPAGLTAREIEVLRLVALGLSDAEAAERLFVSVRTVNAHLRSVYRKAGVRSRAAAGRFAEENGLL